MPTLDDVKLIPFMPMLYVAWADGELSDEEIRELRRSVGDGCDPTLDGWLDPEHPPTASDLQLLLGRIRRAASSLSAREKLSLAELGLALAQAGDHQVSESERVALVALEKALGILGHEAARQLLATRRPVMASPPPKPEFDVAKMSHWLDGEHRELRQRVRQLLCRDELRQAPASDRERYRDQVLSWCRLLADEGLGALSYPRSCGGENDMGRFIAVFETLAYHDLSLLVKFGVQFGLFGGSVLQLGTERHHREFLPAIGRLELPGCFAMTETAHGSNVADLETVAHYDATTQEFVIHTPHPGARKDYIGNAARHGRWATVFAQLVIGEEEHGVHAFLVPIRDAAGQPCRGVSLEDCGEKLGLNGVDNGRLSFDQVRVPHFHLLDRFAHVDADGNYSSPIASPTKRFFTMLGTLVGGRVSVACAALSATKSALTIALRYAASRRQFGPLGEPESRLLDYLSHQRRLLPLLAQAYALHFALEHLRQEYERSTNDADRRQLESLAAGLKVFSTWSTTQTLQVCRECCGGQGYLAINRFASLKADTDVFTTFEGDNVVLLQLVAKGLLTDYKHQFNSMSLYGLLRFLTGRATTALVELNPVIIRMSDEKHLRDRGFQLAALRWREDHLLGSLARRLKKRLDEGHGSHQAMILCQDHLLATALAHVERILVERFSAAIERCPEEDLRRTLKQLCDLFALWRIESDKGWFLEHGYLEAVKSKAIRNQVNKLCGEAAHQALPLVDAFGIPSDLLGAPISR